MFFFFSRTSRMLREHKPTHSMDTGSSFPLSKEHEAECSSLSSAEVKNKWKLKSD